MPVVAGPGEALGRYGSTLGPGAGLQDVEEREADGLLQLVVTFDLDVGPGPKLVEILVLLGEETFPSDVGGGRDRGPTWSRSAGMERTDDHPYATTLLTRRD